MIYAPVVLCTLNRYEHLKCCLESLKRNAWASKTELYISVDFPVKESHEKGYKKVKQYLDQGLQGFASINIFYQTKNLGPDDNYKYIKERAFEKYDRIILTEDDNEFSPHFLEYVDRLLEKYEGDDTVFAVSGYNYLQNWKDKGEGILKLDNIFSAYGCGLWRKKEKDFIYAIEKQNMDSMMKQWKIVSYISKKNPAAFNNLISCYLGTNRIMKDTQGYFKPTDSVRGIYMLASKKCIVVPKVSQVLNHGFDGSGVNCTCDVETDAMKKKETEVRKEWDKDEERNYSDRLVMLSYNSRKVRKMMGNNWRHFCVNWFHYLLYQMGLKMPSE